MKSNNLRSLAFFKVATHRVANLLERRIGNISLGEIFFQIGVGEARFSTWRQPISHAQHDEAARLIGIEAALAIVEAAFVRGDVDDFATLQIECAYSFNGIADLLSVGADILHRSSAYRAGNPAHALDAGIMFFHYVRDKLVPIFASPNIKDVSGLHNAFDPNMQYQATPACIGNQQVATPTQHKKRKRVFARVVHRRRDLKLRFRLRVPARRTAHLEGR